MERAEASAASEVYQRLEPGRLTRLMEQLAAAPPGPPASIGPGPGETVGRFRLEREIGRGGFGRVFLATDLELGREVALKVLRHERTGAGAGGDWVRREAEAAAQLRHPNVVTLHDAGRFDGGAYLVYELLRGETLADRLLGRPVPRREGRRILAHLAAALAHAHAAGVVHRDVKPANVFLEEDGTVKLLDLGLAQVAGAIGVVAGSPPWMAPEQARGAPADARADVYAWGLLAGVLLEGLRPSEPRRPAGAGLRASPLRLPGSLAALGERARSPEPELRPADGTVLLDAIRRMSRRRARAGLLGLGLAAAAAVVLVSAWIHRARPGVAEATVDRAVRATLEAHRSYTAGLRCLAEPSRGESWIRSDCGRHFREALEHDPEFPLAHFELARDAVTSAAPTAELKAALRPALARIERVPPRERAQLLAWQADLEGRPDEAVATLRRAVAEFPDDARVAFALGSALEGLGRLAEAVEPLERAVALEPELEAATDLLAWTLGRLDRAEALRALADRLAAQPPYPGTLHAEIQARGWSGDVEGALRVARRAAGGGRATDEDLVDALAANGLVDEAEAFLRARAEAGDPAAERRLAAIRYLAGRRREAVAVLDRALPAGATERERFIAGARKAWRLAEPHDGAAIAALAREVRPYSLELAASFAPVLAYSGQEALALELAPHMAGQPGTRRMLDAILVWRRHGPAAALPELRALAGGEGLHVTEIFPPEAPAWLAAECAAEVEPAERALADVRRFQRIYRPLGPWRVWALPRSLLAEARLLDALGRRDEARQALSRLEALWARADPDLPLVAEMKALRRRIGTGGVAAARASDERGRNTEGGGR